jgi:sec-independent protein translocase protein TatA
MDLSAPHVIILLVVVLLLFGSTRLPGAAEALGKSMRIFKSEAKKLHDDDKTPNGATVTPVGALQQPVTPQPLPGQAMPAQTMPAQAAPDATQQQMAELQRQIQDLQRQSAGGAGAAAADARTPEAQPTQPFTS